MRLSTVLFGAALLAGCGIPKSQYNDLEAQYKDAVTQRDAAQADRDKTQQELDEVKARNKKRMEAFSSVYADLLKIEGKGLAKVKIDDGRAVLQLDSDVLFASGSANLTPAGLAAVQEIAKVLAAESDAKFQVEGHTDSDQIKTKEFPTNWHLGADRAINVTLEMVKAGMPANRISAATYADTNPVADNSTPDGKKANRRIDLVWMPELSDLLPYKKMMNQMNAAATAAPAPAAPAPAAPAPAPK
jgi:chemotaxis protein MotB